MPRTLTLTTGTEVVLEDFSGRRAIRAMRLARQLGKAGPTLLRERAEFIRTYEAENYTELTRTEALLRFGPVPVRDPEGNLVRNEDGTLVMGPSRLAHLTDEDWEKTGNTLRLSDSPSENMSALAVFPTAMDIAEREVTQLLALVITSNDDYRAAVVGGEGGGADELLKTRADDILDWPAQDLLRLAAAAATLVEEQFSDTIAEMRQVNGLGKLMGLFGAKDPDAPLPTTPAETSTSRQTSSTDSDGSTDGVKPPFSTAPAGGSSSDSRPE